VPLSGITVKNWTAANTPIRIRALLAREDATQQTLAVALGVSVSTVARWCGRDNKHVPDMRSRIAIQRMINKTEGGR